MKYIHRKKAMLIVKQKTEIGRQRKMTNRQAECEEGDEREGSREPAGGGGQSEPTYGFGSVFSFFVIKL